MKQNRFDLSISDIPTHYVNLIPDIKKYLGLLPDPHLHPGTHKPIETSDLEAIFPREVIKQEMSLEPFIEIPDEVREQYARFRPTPVYRAFGLEKVLNTPAHIYYKYEGATITGSHKINTALAQAYYNKKEGTKVLTTETGAGQWGTALSLACGVFGLTCKVFMVRVSFDQKPFRKTIMKMYGADVFASPSLETVFGKKVLGDYPHSPGSLGIAISEALETVGRYSNAKYALGSVLNHVILHQTVVGQEAKKQMEMAGEYPDIIIGCVGGGSNFGGFSVPFLIDKVSGAKKSLRAIGVESSACPKMTEGEYRYDHGDSARMTPLLKMETLGSDFIPPKIHAGGLRYHGNAPLLSFLNQQKITESRAYGEDEIFKAGVLFARSEGIIPAPESAHAIQAAIEEAKKCADSGEKKVILFNLSGHGLLDLKGYEQYIG